MTLRRIRWRSIGACLVACSLLAGCAGDGAKSPSQATSGRGVYKVGSPYQVNGIWYYPAVDYSYVETGIASWYGEDFHGKATANGEPYDMNALTAAHRTLPMPSMVRVTNLENGRQIKLRVNDRGPFANNRIIDVSRRGAQLLGFDRQGTARVRVEILDDESRQLAMLYGTKQRPVRTAGTADASSPEVEAAPAGTLAMETLPPPPGAASSTPQKPIATAASVEPIVGAATSDDVGPQPDGKVTTLPVRKTSMFVQAGAFTNVGNADRLRVKLQPLGRAQVVPATVGNQKFYRVRVGPIASVEEADALLARIVAAGHPDARLIVD